MKKIVLFLFAASIVSTTLIAQTRQVTGSREKKQQKKNERRERINELARLEEEGEIVYNKQNVFSVKLATDGYGLGYEFGKFKSNRKSFLILSFPKRSIPRKKEKDILIIPSLK